ncbi:MAG: M48 family metallopeptidase [Chitinophagaceae bacterium]|jgi:predicted Zn-dependent protease|nr:M48 family metallopeptidase [Chitinophagaceae bacterium]
MKKHKLTYGKFTFLGICMVAIACSVNPLTGRKQLTLVDSGTVNQLAADEYKKVKQTSKIISPATNANAAMVTRVGSRIAQAITEYYTAKGLQQHLGSFEWEYMLIDEKTVNAWCMPGGKIAVYTGLLPVTQNEDALAVVMGHEVAHAIAEHGRERMSQGLMQQLGGVALSVALLNKPAETQSLFMSAYGVGSQVGVMLPFSRSNELEADKLGLIYAALAGYDPRESIPLWRRMATAGSGQKPPEWLSTHPAEENRITQLEKMMPEVLPLYEAKKSGQSVKPKVVEPDEWKKSSSGTKQ